MGRRSAVPRGRLGLGCVFLKAGNSEQSADHPGVPGMYRIHTQPCQAAVVADHTVSYLSALLYPARAGRFTCRFQQGAVCLPKSKCVPWRVCVLDLQPFILPDDIQHDQCPCGFFNPINNAINTIVRYKLCRHVVHKRLRSGVGGLRFVSWN